MRVTEKRSDNSDMSSRVYCHSVCESSPRTTGSHLAVSVFPTPVLPRKTAEYGLRGQRLLTWRATPAASFEMAGSWPEMWVRRAERRSISRHPGCTLAGRLHLAEVSDGLQIWAQRAAQRPMRRPQPGSGCAGTLSTAHSHSEPKVGKYRTPSDSRRTDLLVRPCVGCTSVDVQGTAQTSRSDADSDVDRADTHRHRMVA